MNKKIALIGFFLVFLVGLPAVYASEISAIKVALQKPNGILKMGDTPSFTGIVKNAGEKPEEGLIVYLSLVSLEKGSEHPVDLEDWSANRAVRIDKLMPGQSNVQKWKMRLIKSGEYGVLLTVVNPKEKHPIMSDLVRFSIASKPAVESKRIKIVAIGIPLLITIILLLLSGLFKSKKNKL